MENDGVTLWLQKQLKPLFQAFNQVSPYALSWLSLAVSLLAGAMLYSSYDVPGFALAVIPLLCLRLTFDAWKRFLESEGQQGNLSTQLISPLCDRLADVSLFLGFAFWTEVRVHLVLLAIISMLLVSYVGELGRSLNARAVSGGLLCKAHRIILLMFFCLIYSIKPGIIIEGFSAFETMFVLFIPLASLTLLQRMDSILK